MDSVEHFDVIVIGAGIIGSWTAYHLAKSGKSTLLLEQFPALHTRGSSHGASRILRKSYVDEHYAAMMSEAYQLWEEMERSSGIGFMKTTGHLSISKTQHGHVGNVIKWCKQLGIPCSALEGDELHKRFGLTFDDTYSAVLEPSGAVVNADKCLEAVQDAFCKLGGVLRDMERVSNIESLSKYAVQVYTSRGRYKASSLVLACGAWANELLEPLGLRLPLMAGKVIVTYWKERSPGAFAAEHGFPSLLYYTESGFYAYGLPSDEYPGLFKLCYHHYFPIDPNERDKPQPPEELERQRRKTEELMRIIKDHFPLLKCEPVITESCIITDSPDLDYIVDRHPSYKNIIFAAGMSGHAFKTAPVVGKIVSELATDQETSYPTHHYSINRFSKSKM